MATSAMRQSGRNIGGIGNEDLELEGDHPLFHTHDAQLLQRTIQLERDLRGRSNTLSSLPAPLSDADTAAIARMKDELTMCYKRMSEHANTVLELNNQLKLVQEKVKSKEEELEQQKKQCRGIEERLASEQQLVKQHTDTIAILTDELRAIQRDLARVEGEKEKIDKDYQELLDRWLKKKQEEAEAINEANQLTIAQLALSRAEALRTHVTNMADPMAPDEGYAPRTTQLPSAAKRTVQAHKDEVTCLTFGSYTLLATGSSDKTVKLWDAKSMQSTTTLHGSGSAVTCVGFSVGAEFIIASSNDNAARLWSVAQQRLRHTLTGHTGKVTAAIFSSDSQRVYTSSHDRTLKLWDLGKGYCIKTILCFSACNDLIVTSDGTMLVSAHLDSSMRVWDVRSGQQVREVPGLHSKQITSLQLHPVNGSTVLTCSRDNTLRLVDLHNYAVVQTYKDEGYKSGVNWNRACFSPDGTCVAAGSTDGNVFIWHTQSAKLLATLTGQHTAPVAACAWNPNGMQLASCDNNGKVVMWEP